MHSFILAALLFWASAASAADNAVKYCVPVKSIDFNPFREIKDGKELAFLTLLRSYISTEPEEPGLLSAYEFAPDGKIFTGRIMPGQKWADGSAVTALQLAEGIAKTLPFRPLGKRVKASKIEIVDKVTFKIILETDIENPTGVFREALSTNSRHNRFWPIKKDANQSVPFVLGKFPQGKGASFTVGTKIVAIVGAKGCLGADMSIFPESIGPDLTPFKIIKSPAQSSIFIQVNSQKLNRGERVALVSLIRNYFEKANEKLGITPVRSFFLPGEPGFTEALVWPSTIELKGLPERQLVIGMEHPLFNSVMNDTEAVKTSRIRLVTLPTDLPLDAHLLASGMQDGRHVIFQDILKWTWVSEFLKEAPLTLKNLKGIAERSASTVPPDNKILAAFEAEALQESALAPVARRRPLAYTRKTLPIHLNFNKKGEITFRVGAP